MPITDEEIVRTTEQIWAATLQMDTQPAPSLAVEELAERTLSGSIHIAGDWQGALLLQIPETLAREVVQALYHRDPQDVTFEKMQDALGEITNMTGGNLKGLIPGICHLSSLPAVIEGRDYGARVPGTTVLKRVVLCCADQPVVVTLLAAQTEAPGRDAPNTLDTPRAVGTG